MKKYLVILSLLLVSQVSFGVDIIVKHNKGLFGYDRIDETHAGGNNQLNCTDPGTKGCKWSSLTTNNDVYENILSNVDRLIYDGRVSTGNFEMDGYYVQFDFDLRSDYLIVKIYTHSEAQENGFIL